ncbi:MAG: ester cyclase, partial [Chloroflexota bacterium]
PTGRRYEIDEMHIFGIRDGQVAEHWHAFDKADLMRQLAGTPDAVSPSRGRDDRDDRDEWDAD